MNQREKSLSETDKKSRLLWIWGVVFAYMLVWFVTAYLVPTAYLGLLGFPLWFELSCLYTPLGFIVVAGCCVYRWRQ